MNKDKKGRTLTKCKLKIYRRGVPFKRALGLVEEARGVMVSNKRLEAVLERGFESSKWEEVSKAFPCRTGTLTAHTVPDIAFSETVEYVDSETSERWIFPVPKKYQGIKNGILVVEHPNYTVRRNGGILVVWPERDAVGLVENFPEKNGWYMTDPEYGIPVGRQCSDSSFCRKGARYLYREEKGVIPVVRDYGYDWYSNFKESSNNKYGFFLNYTPSRGYGVIVEAP